MNRVPRRLLLFSPHPSHAHALRLLVRNAMPGLDLITATTGEQPMAAITRVRPVGVIVDDAHPEVLALLDAFGRNGSLVATKHVALHGSQPALFTRARRLGIRVHIAKSSSAERFCEALRCTAAGEDYYDPGVERRPGRDLTPREIEVLGLIGAGQANIQIARNLGIAPDTVKVTVRRVASKLGCRNRAHAVAEALRLGVIR